MDNNKFNIRKLSPWFYPGFIWIANWDSKF